MCGLGFEGWGLGRGAWGLGCGAWGLELGVCGLGFENWGLGCGVWGSERGVWGSGCGAPGGWGVRVHQFPAQAETASLCCQLHRRCWHQAHVPSAGMLRGAGDSSVHCSEGRQHRASHCDGAPQRGCGRTV